jgi:hypothetical protein
VSQEGRLRHESPGDTDLATPGLSGREEAGAGGSEP